MSTWTKLKAEWATPTDITEDGIYTLRPLETTSDGYKILLGEFGGLQEYLLLENRQKLEFDLYLYGTGLAIYHIDDVMDGQQYRGYPGQVDDMGNAWPANGLHYEVAMVQADGLFALEQAMDRGNDGDLWQPGQVLGPGNSGTVFPNTDRYQNGVVVESGITITVVEPDAENEVKFLVSGLGGGSSESENAEGSDGESGETQETEESGGGGSDQPENVGDVSRETEAPGNEGESSRETNAPETVGEAARATDPPTASPTLSPITEFPTFSPTLQPTGLPTSPPTILQTQIPTFVPTTVPTFVPTTVPTPALTIAPSTDKPTVLPGEPTQSPTPSPTVGPTVVTQSPTTTFPTTAQTMPPGTIFQAQPLDQGTKTAVPASSVAPTAPSTPALGSLPIPGEQSGTGVPATTPLTNGDSPDVDVLTPGEGVIATDGGNTPTPALRPTLRPTVDPSQSPLAVSSAAAGTATSKPNSSPVFTAIDMSSYSNGENHWTGSSNILILESASSAPSSQNPSLISWSLMIGSVILSVLVSISG